MLTILSNIFQKYARLKGINIPIIVNFVFGSCCKYLCWKLTVWKFVYRIWKFLHVRIHSWKNWSAIIKNTCKLFYHILIEPDYKSTTYQERIYDIALIWDLQDQEHYKQEVAGRSYSHRTYQTQSLASYVASQSTFWFHHLYKWNYKIRRAEGIAYSMSCSLHSLCCYVFCFWLKMSAAIEICKFTELEVNCCAVICLTNLHMTTSKTF